MLFRLSEMIVVAAIAAAVLASQFIAKDRLTGTATTASSPSTSTVCADAATAGTIVYVKPAATGTGTGADWTNARAFPTSPTRGKVYCLADGSYGSKEITGPSGSSAIVYKKATVADHGTSTGWSDTLGDGTADFTHVGFNDADTNGFITLNGYSELASLNRGITITNTAENGGTLVNFGSGAHDHTVTYIAGTGNQAAANTTCQILVDLGFEGANATKSNITISHSSWSGGDTNAQIHTASGIVWEYNDFSNNTSTSTCHGNVLLTQVCASCVFRYNTVTNWLAEGIFITFPGGSADVGEQQTWDIYGNVFYAPNSSQDNSRVIESYDDASVTTNLGGWGPINFYNNTVVGPNTFPMMTLSRLKASSAAYNNLFYNCNTNGSGIGGFPIHDYSWTKTCVDADFAGESNEQVGGGDPFVNAAGGNYHLSAETTAGFTLSSPYNADRDGVTRGSIGTWDRGAYEK